jgi:hypothetical protein
MGTKTLALEFDDETGKITRAGKPPKEAKWGPPDKQGEIGKPGEPPIIPARDPGVVMFSHSSPGCYTVFVNGMWYYF